MANYSYWSSGEAVDGSPYDDGGQSEPPPSLILDHDYTSHNGSTALFQLSIQRHHSHGHFLSPTTEYSHTAALADLSSIRMGNAGFAQSQAEFQPGNDEIQSIFPASESSFHQKEMDMTRSTSQYSSTSFNRIHQEELSQYPTPSTRTMGLASPAFTPALSRSISQYSHATDHLGPAPRGNIAEGTLQVANQHSRRWSGPPAAFQSAQVQYDASMMTRNDIPSGFNFNESTATSSRRDRKNTWPVQGQLEDLRLLEYNHVLPNPDSAEHNFINQSTEKVDDSSCPSTSSRASSLSPSYPSTSHNVGSFDDDPITGNVTLSGKFKCVDRECADLTFGRQADFKRHLENVHARMRVEFFCRFEGCARSCRPENGKKGRSFKGRKDKMEEHVRTVHEGKGKKREGSREREQEEGRYREKEGRRKRKR